MSNATGSSAVAVEGGATVRAPADRVYELIANYRTGHPRIGTNSRCLSDELALLDRIASSDLTPAAV